MKSKYTLVLDGMKNERNCSEERVVDYAKARLEANPEDHLIYITSADKAEIITAIGEDQNNRHLKLIDWLFDDSNENAIRKSNVIVDKLHAILARWNMELDRAIEIINSYGEEVRTQKTKTVQGV